MHEAARGRYHALQQYVLRCIDSLARSRRRTYRMPQTALRVLPLQARTGMLCIIALCLTHPAQSWTCAIGSVVIEISDAPMSRLPYDVLPLLVASCVTTDRLTAGASKYCHNRICNSAQ